MKKEKAKSKVMWKWAVPAIACLIGMNLASNLVNKYWFPPEIRQFLLPPKFSEGQCIQAKNYWGVNPKSVVGYKVRGEESFYLLKDQDKYEHLQVIQMTAVEKVATRVPCGHAN